MAPAPPPAPHPVTQLQAVESVRYQCAGGLEIQVAYPADEGNIALVAGGQLHLLRPWPAAASGMRFVSLDEQVGLRWHARGMDGALWRLAPDHMAQEELLAAECRVMTAPQ